MRLPHISSDGFRRIAQAAPQSPSWEFAPGALNAPVDMAQMRRDIDTLNQWIDHFEEQFDGTQQEIDALRDQVEFLEEYVYSTTGQPVQPEAVPGPAPSPYETDYNPAEMEDYFKTLPYPPTLY